MGKSGAASECFSSNGGNPLRNCDVGDRFLVYPRHAFDGDFRIFGEGKVSVVDYCFWHGIFFTASVSF